MDQKEVSARWEDQGQSRVANVPLLDDIKGADERDGRGTSSEGGEELQPGPVFELKA